MKKWLRRAAFAAGALVGLLVLSLAMILSVGTGNVTVMLLMGAGLLIRSFIELQRIDLGYDDENVLTMRLSLPVATYDSPESIVRYYREVLFPAHPGPDTLRPRPRPGLRCRDSGSDAGLDQVQHLQDERSVPFEQVLDAVDGQS